LHYTPKGEVVISEILVKDISYFWGVGFEIKINYKKFFYKLNKVFD